MTSALPADLADLAADIRTTLSLLRLIRIDPAFPPAYLPLLDAILAANELALARLEALTANNLDATG